MHCKKIIVPALLSTLVLVKSAFAADVWVGPAGNDNAVTSTQAAPFKTLAKAALVVNPGDVVRILPGTYQPFTVTRSGTLPASATIGLPTGATQITWRPFTAGTVEIVGDSSGNPAIRVQASYNTFDGLTIRGNTDAVALQQVRDYYSANPTGNTYNGSGIVLDNSTNTTPAHGLFIKNSIIRNFGCHAVEVIGADYTVLERNQIYDNAWYSSKNCSGLAVSVAPRVGDPAAATINAATGAQTQSYHNVIVQNKLWNNRVQVTNATLTRKYAGGNGIVFGPVDPAYLGRSFIYTNIVVNNGGSAITLSDVARTEVGYNTTYRNGATAGAAEMTVTGAKDINVKANIFSASPGGKVYAIANNIVTTDPLQKADINNNQSFNGLPYGPEDVASDPLFLAPGLDPRVADFRLNASSPAVDAGWVNGVSVNPSTTKLRNDLPNNPASGSWGFDADGLQFRGIGIAADRGAYEFTFARMPAGWGNQSVGMAVGVGASADSAGETYGTWLFIARGTGLRGTADSIANGFRSWTGDVVITAKLVSAFIRDNPEAVTGVMIRGGASVTTQAANSAHVATVVSPTVGAMYVRRPSAGASTKRTLGKSTKSLDIWVRIARVGNVITSSTSDDGVKWDVIRTESVVLPATVQVGLIAANGKQDSFVTANQIQYTNVTVAAP